MRQWIKDSIRKEAIGLGKSYSIKDVNRIETILRKTARSNSGTRLDTDEGVSEANEYGLCFNPSLEELLVHLSPEDAMQLLESNEPNELWYVIDFLIDRCESAPFLYTYQELASLLEEFIAHLQENKASLLETGYPSKVFEVNHWLFSKLSTLYPVKIPYSITGVDSGAKKDSDETALLYTWHKGRTAKRSGSSSNECSYIEASFIEKLSDREIFEVEEKRERVFQTKIEILKILHESLAAETAAGLWDKCLHSLSRKLSQEDFHALVGVEEKFSTLSRTDISHRLSFILVKNRPLNLTASLLNCGGIKNILGIIEFIERELKMGRMHKMKTKLLAINGNEKIRSYYHLLLSGTVPQLIDAEEQFKTYNKEEEEHFKKIFNGRLERDISRHSKIPMLIKPEYYDIAKAFAEYVHDKNVHANLVDRLRKIENAKEGITPIELPIGTRWEDITIRFLDGESVQIKAKELSIKRTYQNIGLVDHKSNLKPNKQWQFFSDLSKLHGKLTWKDPKATLKVKKKKSLLSKALREYFQLKEDPFYPYKEVKAYKTKFKLIPESGEEYTLKPEDDFGEITEDSLDYTYQ